MELSHLIDGYNFWTIFGALPPMIWFYPMNKLDLTGYEAFVLVLFSPILLKLEWFQNSLKSRLGLLMIQLMMAFSLLSFQSSDTYWRLCFVAFGASIAALKLALDLSASHEIYGDASASHGRIWGYVSGYIALLASRVAYKTITPAFNDRVTNWSVFTVCLGNLLFQAMRDITRKKYVATPSKRPPLKLNTNRYYLTAAAFGSLLYIKLSIFGEITVPFRWFVESHPNTGLEPNPWALLILLFMIIGYWLGYYFSSIALHPLWSLVGCLSFLGLYKLGANEGLLAACVLTVYVCSLWIVYINSFEQCTRPGIPFVIAMLFYLIPAFYAVWTVAYNFVPLGFYAREFTGLSIGWLMFFIALDIYFRWRTQTSFITDRIQYINFRSLFGHVIVLFLVACAAMFHRYINWNRIFLSTAKGQQLPPDQVDHVTSMIWTYHFGYDNDGWPSLDRTAKLIKDIDADIIGLLETDASRLYMGSNDLAQWLAETLDMYVDYGPATKKHTWGCILLSKYPIMSSRHHLLPSPYGELAPAISALLRVGGQNLSVILTHMGNDGDDLDRKLQTEYLSDLSSNLVRSGIPTIFLGYVTSPPYHRDYNVFMKRGLLKDIDNSDKSRFCEYIFYQNLIRMSYARISKGRLSDTEIQVAKFGLGQNSEDNEIMVTKETGHFKIPKNRYFSSVFGDYFDGHYFGFDHKFHMSTPKYFLSKDEAQ